MELLHLTEAISNAPHAQQLTVQFANDANDIGKLLHEFNKICGHVFMAQHTVADCYLQLSEISKKITCQVSAVQPKNDDFEQTGLQFSSMLEELSGLHRGFGETLRDCLFAPPHKLPSQPGLQLFDSHLGPLTFSDTSATKRNLDACEHEVENAVKNYMRLPKRCLPKIHDDAIMDLSQRRCQFKKAAVAYTARLNATVFEKELIPLTAFHGFLTSLQAHAKRVSEMTEAPSIAAFCETIRGQLDCRQIEASQSTADFLNTMTTIETQPLANFAPEPLLSKSDRSYLRGPDTTLLSRSGYLFMRIKRMILTDWIEVYCYTQGGNLLYQQKTDLGASVLVNLNAKGVFAEPLDIDDRRYTFQIVSASDKKTVVLQAENSTDRDEWIATLSNVIASTNSLAVKDHIETAPKSPQPFVLPGKLDPFSPPTRSRAATTDLNAREEDELMTAIRMSMSVEDWLQQNPPLLLHLTPLSTAEPAAAEAAEPALQDDPTVSSSSCFKLTFTGCIVLPEYLGELPSLLKTWPHVLAKASEPPGVVSQLCEASVAPSAVSLVLVEHDSSSVTIARFVLAQIVHCVAPPDVPRLLVLLISPPHAPHWKKELLRGDMQVCYFFKTDQATDFAEAVLSAQLNLLAHLPDSDTRERNALMENVSRSEILIPPDDVQTPKAAPQKVSSEENAHTPAITKVALPTSFPQTELPGEHADSLESFLAAGKDDDFEKVNLIYLDPVPEAGSTSSAGKVTTSRLVEDPGEDPVTDSVSEIAQEKS